MSEGGISPPLAPLDKQCRTYKTERRYFMTKRETLKWTLQIIASVITAVLTALGATSCMGM